jgi:chemotaxis signal transduction protein
MDDELSEFRDDAAEAEAGEEAKAIRELLVFEIDAECFAVEATRVASVVTYRPPAPVPQGSPALAGVAQDAGKIIAVMHHPLGRKGVDRQSPPTRLVVCDTARGLVGFPAHVTHGIVQAVATGGLIDTAFGAASVLEPEAVARALLGSA